MKRLLLAGVLLLAACTPPVPTDNAQVSKDDHYSEADVTLESGRVIHCLFWGSSGSQTAIGGMSCDWTTK